MDARIKSGHDEEWWDGRDAACARAGEAGPGCPAMTDWKGRRHGAIPQFVDAPRTRRLHGGSRADVRARPGMAGLKVWEDGGIWGWEEARRRDRQGT